MFSVFVSSYRNTHESFGDLEKAVETLFYGSCSHSISRYPNFPLVFLTLDRNNTCFLFLKFITQRVHNFVMTTGTKFQSLKLNQVRLRCRF